MASHAIESKPTKSQIRPFLETLFGGEPLKAVRTRGALKGLLRVAEREPSKRKLVGMILSRAARAGLIKDRDLRTRCERLVMVSAQQQR